MSKLSKGRLKTLITLMLIAIGSFVLINHFVFQPKKKKAAYEQMRQEAQERQEQQGTQQAIPIKVIDVIRHDYVDILDALGNIKGGVEFKLTFSIPGRIKSINYREGEKYKKGALLMSIDDEDIILRMRRVEANMNKSQTAVDIARQKLEEHTKLYNIGAIPKTTLEKVKLELESALYDYEAAQLEVKANESILDKTNLYAVSDGMIGELYVEEGETITANTLLGTHILTEFVKAEFGVIERDMRKIQEGQPARIYVDAYPSQMFSGVVESISPVVGGVSRTATVSVKLDNKDGLLLPGMFARINVDLFKKKDALVIPSEAIIEDEEGKTYVYVLSPEGETVQKREIQVGYSRTDYSQIDSGIEEGETIAITSLEDLTDGEKVEVVEKQTLELE